MPSDLLSFNQQLNRVELVHPKFADRREVARLKSVLLREKERFGATRSVLRALTSAHVPIDDDKFKVEGRIKTPNGELSVFGFNDECRLPSPQIVAAEVAYQNKIISYERRIPPQNLEIKRLEAGSKIAEDLELVYAATYSYYPKPLDAPNILRILNEAIGYAVLQGGNIVSVLFGEIRKFDAVHTVELTYSATLPSERGAGMTVALAHKIKEEAVRRFPDPVIFAETIAAPVMRSCHDFGMSPRGVLREHFRIALGDLVFTNMYLWSL